MLSYHGKVATKRKYLARVRAHRRADEIIQGTGWSGGKGCAVGCTLHGYDHARYPIELGVPLELAHLEDRIFEGLTREESHIWPERFLAAIPVGADLSMVWPRFALWTLRGLPAASLLRDDVRKAVDGVAALYSRWIETDVKPGIGEWMKARSAAYAYASASAAAYAYASASAAAYAAAYAAYAYAYAYASAAAYADAATDAAASAARSEARRQFWTDAAAQLESLLKSSKA